MSTTPIDQYSNAEYLPIHFEINNIYALGLSYKEHLKEVGEKPGKPVVFRKDCKPTMSGTSEVTIPTSQTMFNAIERLDDSKAQWLRDKFNSMPTLLDYEIEVAMILLEDLNMERLTDTTYQPPITYALTNDLTARSVQIAGEGSQDRLKFWALSKSFPGFLPMTDHMWIPRKPDLEHYPEFTLKTYVNGEKRQCSSTSQILYSPRQILQMAAENSANKCLSKHDMILTGTPSGIGLTIPLWKRRLSTGLPTKMRILSALRSNKKNPRLLKQGDVVTVCGGVLGKQTAHVIGSV